MFDSPLQEHLLPRSNGMLLTHVMAKCQACFKLMTRAKWSAVKVF
jgi:hypothetical protein